MDVQDWIRQIGRGRAGARSLGYGDALQLFESLFGGALSDLQLGAVLIALRMKGESLDELRAALEVLDPLLDKVRVDAARPVVAIPSYNGARRTANLVPLLACLLADAGVQVVVHGVASDPKRTTTAEIMQAMGLAPVSTAAQASDVLSRGDPAFVPVAVLSPELARLLDLRWKLGVRNVGHTLVKLIDPTAGGRCLQLASFTHPEFNELQHAYFLSTGRSALVSRGTEGEAVANVRREVQVDWIHDGRCDTVIAARSAPVGDVPVLTDAHDAPATARWIQAALAGEHPVPATIAQQVDAVLQAVGLQPRSVQAA